METSNSIYYPDNEIIRFINKYKNNKDYSIGFWISNTLNSYGNTYKFSELDLNNYENIKKFASENYKPFDGNFYKFTIEVTDKNKIVIDKLQKMKYY